MHPTWTTRATRPGRRLALTTALTATLAASLTALCSPPAEAAAGSGTVTIGGLCLDDADFGTQNGNTIQVFTCNGSTAQQWTWQPNGEVTVYGMCLDVTAGSNATGALIELYTCSAAPEQQFSYLPDGTIYAEKSGKCLVVQGGSITNNALIGLASCDPSKANEDWAAAAAPAAQYTLSAGGAVQFSNVDDTPSSPFIAQNGQFYYQSSHSLYGATDSRAWDFYTGSGFDTATADTTLDNAVSPNNSSDSNANTTARCNNSPTGLSATDAPAGSSYAEANYCDLTGIWVDPDTGNWYGLVHNEFTPQPFGDGLHFDAIDFALSTDQGKTWTIEGHAVTSPFSTARGNTTAFPNSSYYYGDGDPRLFVDYASGYFYVFYASRTLDKSGGTAVWLQHVARAPIAGKMVSGSWEKWYNGSWSQAGVGGAESDIIPSDGVGQGYLSSSSDYSPSTAGTVESQVAAGTMPDNSQLAVMNVAYDAYLGEYIGTPQNTVAQDAGTLTPLHFYATKDLATEQWTDMGLVSSEDNAAWYRWFLDSANATSSSLLGRTFRSYCAYYCSTYSGEYVNVTIAPTSPAQLPTEPVASGVSYQIAAGNGLFVEQNGSSLTTASGSASAAAQQWNFTPTGDGFFTITNASTGQALGVDSTGNAGRAFDAPVTPGALGSNPTVGQEWEIQQMVTSPASSGSSSPTGTYRLVNRFSGLALSLTAGTSSVATAPQRAWDNTGSSGDTRSTAAQRLTFTAASGTASNTVAVTNPGSQSSMVNTAISTLAINATDSAPNQILTYRASGLPAGLTLNTSTGQITGTPTTAGTSTVTVTVTDGTGASGNTTFSWTVSPLDLALNKTTTASSVESGTSFTGNLATDGNPNTRWSSAYADPQWLEVDLGAPHTVNEVKLVWEAAYATAFQIQVSNDGSTWSTIYSTTTATGGTQDLTGLSGSGRYIRMYGTQRATGYGYSLYTFSVYGN